MEKVDNGVSPTCHELHRLQNLGVRCDSDELVLQAPRNARTFAVTNLQMVQRGDQIDKMDIQNHGNHGRT